MTDAMVIDTNVFEHVFNADHNTGGHIDRLLRKFVEQRRKLCMDQPSGRKKPRILSEYKNRLQFHQKAMDEHGQFTQWLRYLLDMENWVRTEVGYVDQLMLSIAVHMDLVDAERSDQIFVYVACRLDSVMVSNNSVHVTDLRDQLQGCAVAIGNNNADFMPSVEAEASM